VEPTIQRPSEAARSHPGGDPLDDRGPLELGEHREHLQHHLAGGGGGIERLGCRAK